MKKLLNKKGFTLIELIVVIAILAILALILIPSLFNYIQRAERQKDSANARSTYSSVALDVATGAITANGSTTLADGMVCSYTVVDKAVDTFSCVKGGITYSTTNNFGN